MIGPHTQGSRSADHFALLGLTGAANRRSGGNNGVTTRIEPATFTASTALTSEPSAPAPAEDAPSMASATKQGDEAALRRYAATLLSDASRTAKQPTEPAKLQVPNDRLSPFSLAAMLLLAGCVFLLVIPPVGVTFLLCAVLPLVWGAGTAALKSS